MDYKKKYLKYKLKYLTAKKLYGGAKAKDKKEDIIYGILEEKGVMSEFEDLGEDIWLNIKNYLDGEIKPEIEQLSNYLFRARFPRFPNKEKNKFEVLEKDLRSLEKEIVRLITHGNIDFKEGEWVYIDK